MAEIKIIISEIDSDISKLHSLHSRCIGAKATPPNVVGGGQAVGEMEEIAKLFKELNADTAELIMKSVSFLQSVKASYVASDTSIASGISRGT